MFQSCGAVDDQGNPLTDSEDHKSHMAYFVNGECPTTHPIRYPELHYELYFSNTGDGVPNWEEGLNPKQPFVLSNGK